MSWPGTDFEVAIQVEIDHLRRIADEVRDLIAANEGNGERTDIAWARVRRAYAAYQAIEKAEI